MTYGNSTDLGYLILSITDSVASNLKSYALEIADTWVNSQIPGGVSGTVPDMVEKAATYYAYSFILRTLYDVSLEDTPSAIKFEQMAKDLLAAYVAQTADEDSEIHPYSGNLTPTNVFMQRNKRTAYDDTDYENVEEPNWEPEE